jgi:hypothetical protein
VIITYYLDISRGGKLAEQLRQCVAGLQGSQTIFCYCGVNYGVSSPNEVKVIRVQPNLPRVIDPAFAELLARISFEETVESSVDITGGYRRPNSEATVKHGGSGRYQVGLTGSTLATATRLREDILTGRAGRSRRTMR